MTQAIQPLPPANILLIRIRCIGDIVLTLPAVHAVRANFPSAQISYLTSNENAGLLKGFRDIDTIIPLDRAALQTGNPIKMATSIMSLLRRLRAGKFDLVVDFQGYGETALLARLTGAPQRWGSLYSKGRAWAYTHGMRRRDEIHPADWCLSMLEQCGLSLAPIKNEFAPPDDALAAAANFLSDKKLDPAKATLFIQPFTSSQKKDWPVENFLVLGRCWQAQFGQVIFGGGPADRVRLQRVQDEGFAISAGESLLVTSGLMKLSHLVIGGDTGVLHLAVAMGKRVVMLMETSREGSPHPYQQPTWALAPPSGERVAVIPVGEVFAACEQAMRKPIPSLSVSPNPAPSTAPVAQY